MTRLLAAVLTPHRRTALLIQSALAEEGVTVEINPDPLSVEELATCGELAAAFVDRWYSAVGYRTDQIGSDAFKLLSALHGRCSRILIVDDPEAAVLSTKFDVGHVVERFRVLRKYVNPGSDVVYKIGIRRQWRIFQGVPPEEASRQLPPPKSTGLSQPTASPRRDKGI